MEPVFFLFLLPSTGTSNIHSLDPPPQCDEGAARPHDRRSTFQFQFVKICTCEAYYCDAAYASYVRNCFQTRRWRKQLKRLCWNSKEHISDKCPINFWNENHSKCDRMQRYLILQPTKMCRKARVELRRNFKRAFLEEHLYELSVHFCIITTELHKIYHVQQNLWATSFIVQQKIRGKYEMGCIR